MRPVRVFAISHGTNKIGVRPVTDPVLFAGGYVGRIEFAERRRDRSASSERLSFVPEIGVTAYTAASDREVFSHLYGVVLLPMGRNAYGNSNTGTQAANP